jgi:hypothetical protein
METEIRQMNLTLLSMHFRCVRRSHSVHRKTISMGALLEYFPTSARRVK